MKKFPFAISLLALFLLVSCTPREKPVFTGYWRGEDGMVFEVFQTTPGENNYTIRNVNGDLFAHIEGDTLLTGKNSLEMPFEMRVVKDSAFYEFGTILSKYDRIDKATYDELFKKLTPVTVE